MLTFDLKALNVSGHCKSSRYRCTEFANVDVETSWTVLLQTCVIEAAFTGR